MGPARLVSWSCLNLFREPYQALLPEEGGGNHPLDGHPRSPRDAVPLCQGVRHAHTPALEDISHACKLRHGNRAAHPCLYNCRQAEMYRLARALDMTRAQHVEGGACEAV